MGAMGCVGMFCHCKDVDPGLPSGHGGGDSLATRREASSEGVEVS